MNIKELGLKYKLDNQKDVWELPAKKGTWIITHDAVEKIMAIENIAVEKIEVLNSEWDFCRLLVTCSNGDKKVTTIGEALLNQSVKIGETRSGQPKYKGNCESQYIGAMAEKRGIDRAVLKLIDAYQYGIFSDVESDTFSQKADDKATEKQLDAIRRYMETKGVLIIEYIGKEFGCTMLPELTKSQASDVISMLKGGEQ
jgi:hypothetical protein